MDFQKHIEYWLAQADNDVSSAELLINNGKILHGLFFCHLSIEKVLKAHVVNETKNFAPRTHNLFTLLEKTDQELNEEDVEFLGVLMKYQFEGRYPEFHPIAPPKNDALKTLNRVKKLILWLKKSL